MFAKLVLPEALGCAGVGRPIRVHVVQKVGLAKGLENRSDVGVLAVFVAELIKGAVAVVWPGIEFDLAEDHHKGSVSLFLLRSHTIDRVRSTSR